MLWQQRQQQHQESGDKGHRWCAAHPGWGAVGRPERCRALELMPARAHGGRGGANGAVFRMRAWRDSSLRPGFAMHHSFGGEDC